MKTILTVANSALDELVLSRVVSLYGSTNDLARLMSSLMNRQGKALRDEREGGWTVMQRLHTFVTVAGTAEYALPADYIRLIEDTVWDRTLTAPGAGPLSPAQWQMIKSGLIGTGAYSRRYRIVRSQVSGVVRKFIIDPTPTAVETLVFEYLSTDWCCSSDQLTTREDFAADTDLILLDPTLMQMGLIWRYKRAKGFEYASALAEYNELVDRAGADDIPSQAVGLAKSNTGTLLMGYANIPESGYGI